MQNALTGIYWIWNPCCCNRSIVNACNFRDPTFLFATHAWCRANTG